MARQIVEKLVDDIDGSEASETLRFGLDGAVYEIDLNSEHAEELRNALSRYVGHARPVRASARTVSRSNGHNRPSPAAVRTWAREEGIQVNERGRIPADVLARYEAAHRS